ncbi:MAG: HEAT repeat domain-containing protein [Planctomycetota bacterium]
MESIDPGSAEQWARRALGDALGRALLVGLVCAWFGGWLGALLGVAVAPLTLLEHWGARQARTPGTIALVAGSAWVLACALALWAMFQSIYLTNLVAGGYANAWKQTYLAYIALSDPAFGAKTWSALFCWSITWEWCGSGRAALVTAGSWASIYALGVTLSATLRARSGAAIELGLGFFLTVALACTVLAPGVPPMHTYTSAQGLEEDMSWFGSCLGLALALFAARALVGWTWGRVDREVPRAAPLPHARLAVLSGLVLLGAALLHAATIEVPEALVESPRARALRLIRSPVAGERLVAACDLGRRYMVDRRVFEALIVALSDPDPRVRAAAAGSLSSIGSRGEAVAALVEASRDPDSKVAETASNALGNLAAMGYDDAKQALGR